MNWIGTVIDDRYKIESICSSKGGMGELFFVTDLTNKHSEKLVLKLCTNESDEYTRRFCREIRLLNDFQGNSKVVQVLDSNPDYDKPYHHMPYFVMKYYENGDLTNLIDDLQNNYNFQEEIFNKMILCISELHKNNQYHRDIKPENFLIDGRNIVVSDFGLGMELNSFSRFTNSSVYGGSYGYLPPEYQNGGFKNYDAASDIFMLGKSFYKLLTNRDPAYLSKDNIPPPMYHIIERCCDYDKRKRYQNLAQLQQELQSVFDVILNRGGVIGEVNQLLLSINNNLLQGKYNSNEIINFIRKLSLLDSVDKIRIVDELHSDFFTVLTENSIVDILPQFIDSYAVMVKDGNYAWSYAETIANNMRIVFNSNYVLPETRVKALELAIEAAHLMNRFAAMNTCSTMIVGVDNDELGFLIYPVIQKYAYTFIFDIEPSNCRSNAIRQALIAIKQAI